MNTLIILLLKGLQSKMEINCDTGTEYKLKPDFFFCEKRRIKKITNCSGLAERFQHF